MIKEMPKRVITDLEEWCDAMESRINKLIRAHNDAEARKQRITGQVSPCQHEWVSAVTHHVCRKCGLVDDA